MAPTSDSNLVAHARRELELVEDRCEPDEREMQHAMTEHILKMVETFAEEGHSGFSASYAIAVMSKLLRYEPLLPLTGEDDEWREASEGVFQNIRCSRVFKQAGRFG